MAILSWILFGLVAGAIAKLLMPGRDPGGFIVTILLGIAGSVVGGFLYSISTGRDYATYDHGSFVVAILGSVILLFLYRLVNSRPTTTV